MTDLEALLIRVTPPESYGRIMLKKSENCGCILGHIHEITLGPVPICGTYESADQTTKKQIAACYNNMERDERTQSLLLALFPYTEVEGPSVRVQKAWKHNDIYGHAAVVSLVRDALARETAQ